MPDRVVPQERQVKSVADLLRADADELTVQADLAAMSLRDAVGAQVQAAENAWLAARHRLEMAMSDAEKVLEALKTLASDLTQVVDDVDESVRRSHAGS